MSGYGSYGQQESSGTSHAESGLRGTEYQGAAGANLYQGGALVNAHTYANLNPINAQGQTQYTNPHGQSFTGQQLLPGGRFGLGSNADLAMSTLGSQLFGRTSSDMAARGMVTPENQSAVVGSAITQALPQVLPQLQSWQQAQFMAPMQLGQYAQQNAMSAADFWNRAMGARSDSEQSSFGFNVAAGGGVTPSK